MPAKRKEEKKQEEDIDLSTLPPWISVFTMIEWDASLSEVASLFPIFQFSLITRSDLFNYSKEKGYIANNITEATVPIQTLAKSLSEKVNSMDLQARKAKRDQIQRLEVQDRPQRTESRQTSQVFTEVSVPNNYPIKPDRTYILLNFPKTYEEITTTARYGINIEFFFYIRNESSPGSSSILPHFREAFQKSDKNSPLRTFLEKTITYDLSKYQGMESEVAKLEETKLDKTESTMQQETEKQLRSSKTMKKTVKEVKEEVQTPSQPDLRKLFIAELVKNILETGVLYVKYLIWKETAPCRPLFPSYIVHEVLETTSNTTVSYNGEFGRHFDLPSLDDAAKAWDFRVFDHLFSQAADEAATVEYFLVCLVEQLLNSQNYLQSSAEIEILQSENLLNENDFLALPYTTAGLLGRPACQALYDLYDNFNFPITADRSNQVISSDNANFFFSIEKQELRWMMIINRFEEVISGKTGKNIVLDREYGERLSRPVLNATIQSLLKYMPDVVFCKHDGVTLLGFLYDSSGVPSTLWEHSKKIRPNFQDWKEFNMYPSDFYDVDELKIGQISSQEFNLYPSNGGVLKQIKYSVAQKSLKRCIGLFKDWIFGLQDSGNEAFAVIPGYRISADLCSVKLTSKGQVISSTLEEVLLELTETRMKERVSFGGSFEKNRVVTGKASVIRYFEDGSIQVLYANGNISNYDGKWVVTNNKGNLFSEGREVGLVPCASVTDPKTGLRTVFRDDGTVILYYSGHTIVEFHDGTKILTTQEEYLVESPGYAPVKIKKNLEYLVIVDEMTQIRKNNEKIEIFLKNQQEKVTFHKNFLVLSDFVIDLSMSTISCEDSLGNSFQIGLNQEPSQQIIQKSNSFNDFPRLFAIDESGSGVEIFSSENLKNFLSPSSEKLECQVEDKTFSVFYRPLNKQSLEKGHLPDSLLSNYEYSSVFQMIKPSPVFLKSDETTYLGFRFFEKYPKFDLNRRENFKEKYKNYIEWQSKQNQDREFGCSEFSLVSFRIHLKLIRERSQSLQLKTEKNDPEEIIRKLVETHGFSSQRKKTLVKVEEGLERVCESPVRHEKSRKFTFDSRSVSSTMHSFNYFKSPEGVDLSFASYVKSPEIPRKSSETIQKTSENQEKIEKLEKIEKETQEKIKLSKDREAKTSRDEKDLNESFEENPFISLTSKAGKKVVLKPVSGPSVYSQVEKLQKLRESSERTISEEYHMSKNMNFDLIGGLRKSLPHVSALRSTSPATSKINLKYLSTDLMTETKIKTISQTRRSIFKQPNSITHRRESNPGLSKSVFIQDYVNDPFKRLLEITPDAANFGNVMVGQVASLILMVKNEDCTLVRFAVKQPIVKEVRVVYRPGPIAPGMITKFIVELSSKDVGKIAAEFEVLCKSEIYTIPILANVVGDESLLGKNQFRGLSDKVRQRKLPALNKSIACIRFRGLYERRNESWV